MGTKTTKKTEKKASKAKTETAKKTNAAKTVKKTETEVKDAEVKSQEPGTIQEDLTAFLKPFSENDFGDEDLKKVKTGVAKIVKKYFPPTENHTFTEVYIPENKEMSNTLMVFIGFRKLEEVSFNVFNCMVKLNVKKK